MGRRLAPITLDNLGALPARCRSCVFWELDPVRGEAAVREGRAEAEKEAWISAVLLEWGSCGRIAYVDDVPAGFALYAPAAYVPRSLAFPTSPVAPDAVQLMTGWLLPEYRGRGWGASLCRPWRRICCGATSRRSRRSATRDGVTPPACFPPTISSPWASRRCGHTVVIRGCGWSCGRPSPGKRTWSRRSTACSAP